MALRARGDWSEKLRLICELAANADDSVLQEYLDEIAAEILDGTAAITELFGGFGDTQSALKSIIHLTRGGCRVTNPRSCISEFNQLLATRHLPRTKEVLLRRVAASISGYRPFTREGKEADKVAFKGLVRELISHAGLLGGRRSPRRRQRGPGCCSATTRICLSPMRSIR